MVDHKPVLLDKVLEEVPETVERIVDATLGTGGHAEAMLAKAKKAYLLGLDQDEKTLEVAQARLKPFANRLNIALANFSDLDWAAKEIGWDRVDVILFDLGVSSPQLEDPSYGLSFKTEGPLDMRLNREGSLTAATIVNKWSEREIETTLRELGEESFARSIAKTIVRERARRPLITTTDLVRAIERSIPAREKYRRKVHFATNVFRALRMAVNDELGNLRSALPKAIALLEKGGKLIIVSFHSLEDRIVKQAFRGEAKVKEKTKHPLTPSPQEILWNPRARSAKMRVATKIE